MILSCLMASSKAEQNYSMLYKKPVATVTSTILPTSLISHHFLISRRSLSNWQWSVLCINAFVT